MNNKNTKILFLALSVAVLSGCSSAYKMGQTPDDVYYSPAKVRAQVQQDNDYVSANDQPQRYRGAQRQNNGYDSYEDFDSYRNDRFLRMSIGNSMRMGAFNDYYMYDGYSNWKYNNYAYNINTPWNSYYYWNNYFNPYNTFNFYNPYYGGMYYGGGYGGYGGGGVIIVDKTSVNNSPLSRPRSFSPSSYTNNNYSNSNLYLYRNNAASNRPGTMNTGGRYNNSNSGNNTMRRLPATGNTYYNTNSNNSRSMNSNNNNNNYNAPRNNTYEAPTRSYTPSSPSPSSGSSSGSSSGGGVSRPSRN
jgi:hypothetical protein